MTLIEQRDIIQAAIDRKPIEWKNFDTPWCPLAEGIPFDFNHYQYRVKPEPRELWINFYEPAMQYGHVHNTEQAANGAAACMPVKRIKCLHVRVLD